MKSWAWIMALCLGAAQAQANIGQTLSVRVDEARSEALAPTRLLQGTVVPAQEAELAARVAGRIEWLAPIGSTVQAGEVLVRLDDAAAALAVAAAVAREERLRAEHTLAQAQMARLSAIPDAVPMAQREEAQARQAVLAAQLKEATVAVRAARLAQSEAQLKAPFSGTVTAELMSVGEEAQAGAPLLRLSTLDRVELELAVPVELAGAIGSGATLTVQGEALAAPLAQLRALVPGDPGTRQLRARLRLRGAGAAPMVGSALSAAWPTAQPVPGITVPHDALVQRSDGVRVFRIEGDRARAVSVIPGTRAGDRVAVEGLLMPGDRVVVRGAEGLRDGDAVTVQEASVALR